MKHKDERLKLINDILNGCRIIKFYGFEKSMKKMVSKIRQLEARQIFKSNIINAFIFA
jgi:hypothetical protein